jgi:hypothetical protein
VAAARALWAYTRGYRDHEAGAGAVLTAAHYLSTIPSDE